MSDAYLHPKVAFRVCSENYWGRQYVAGFGSLSLDLKPGREIYTVDCWMPIDQRNPTIKMQQFFMGRTMVTSSQEDGKISLNHLHAEFSGTVQIIVANVVQNRRFMSRESLNHLRYGAVFRKMCLKPDLYWRIMKILMEFDEARRELLRIRAA
uniref:PilZ domain-containing protein n=1 Tax=Heterorhabditis bacteriophora TaxID=37862 RepID=A0A1I7XIY8_HETBA